MISNIDALLINAFFDQKDNHWLWLERNRLRFMLRNTLSNLGLWMATDLQQKQTIQTKWLQWWHVAQLPSDNAIHLYDEARKHRTDSTKLPSW